MSVVKPSFSSRLFVVGFWLTFVFVVVYPFIADKKQEIVKESPVAPAIGIPDFSTITDVVAKKKAFFEYLLPEINRQNELVMQDRLFLLSLQQKTKSDQGISEVNSQRLNALAKNYNVKTGNVPSKLVEALLHRVDIIPPALVLVQAANESAWGTSRFAQQGYNFFGLWCFKKGCGFVPKQRDAGLEHEVAKFPNLEKAVYTYLRNLNRHYAYEEMRKIRHTLRTNQQKVTAEALVHGLMSYSERGQDYIDELLNMVRFNKKYMEL